MTSINHLLRTMLLTGIFGAAFLFHNQGFAQNIQSALPAAGMQRMSESIQDYKRSSEIQRLQKEYQNRQKSEKAEDVKQKETSETQKPEKSVMTIQHLLFDKTDVLKPEFLESLQQEYEGKAVSLTDIKNITVKINEAYKKQGYITSRAYIPEQDIEEGQLKIGLFEGKIGAYLMAENALTSKDYIEEQLNIPTGSVLNITEIEKQILWFNAANDAKMRLALQPSQKKGATDIETIIEEPKRFSVTAFTDNAGQKETGYYRGGIFAGVRNVSQIDMIRDQLNFGGVASRGSKSLFGSYSFTEPYAGTTWTVGMDWSDTDIVGGDLKGLDIEGNFYNYYLSVKKPVWVTEQSVTTASLTGNIKKGATWISDFKTQEVNTDTITAAADNLYIFNGGYLYNQLAATHAARINIGTSKFWHYNYAGEGQANMGLGFVANVKARAQYSNDNFLPSSDQFQVGGVNSVRGYPEGMLVGDKGYTVQTEIKRDIKVKVPHVDRTEGFVFYDFGKAYSAESGDLANTNEAFISSTGVGTRVDFMERLTGTLTAAFPLKRHEFNHDRKGVKFLFYVQAKF